MDNSQDFRCSFKAHIELLPKMLTWIREHINNRGYSKAEINNIEIAVEEALVNIIHYAYAQKPGKIEISYRLFPKDHIELTIIDTGVPFNPLGKDKKINIYASLKERKEGGLGIVFMSTLMDQVDYRREENANILTLKKKCRD